MSSNLFLIGPRGGGKTTVGRIVAGRLAMLFIDADEQIERNAGQSIAAIFADEGEAAFRRREASIFREIGQDSGRVVATGGGIVLLPDNRERLRAHGWTVWLTADAGTLAERIERDLASAARRPDLQGGGVEEIRALLTAREPWYRACADCIVDTGGRSPEDVADAVVQAWRARG